MKIAVFILVAAAAYLLAGLNSAIVLSRLIYHRDIRQEGSKNPGFTNFRRVFGPKYAWFVFALDLLKGAAASVLAGLLFRAYWNDWQLGVAFAGVFGVLGHAYPVWYGFRGGKGFLVCLSTIWFIDWRAGAIATAVLVVLLLTTKYMSLSTMLALTSGAVSAALFGASLPVCLLYAGCVLFVVVRHRENIVRLAHGTESKFTFGHH